MQRPIGTNHKQNQMKEMNHMKKISCTLLNRAFLAAVLAGLPALYAQGATTEFKTEPDKAMAAAQESFAKGDLKAASADLTKAGDFVRKQSGEVAADSKAGLKSAADELDKLGAGVKNGTVKSAAEMKMTFAKVDHEIAASWHKTALEYKSAGKDSTAALNQAGRALDNSAKWSGQQLSEGAKASVEAVKKASKAVGEGVKAGADQVDQWFKGIGDGIADLGKKL